MSRSLATPTRRTSLGWVVIASLVATMVAVPLATQRVDAATPMCLGKKATIVGTRGNDVLRGTARADVIVGMGGKDRILGRGGNDRICGGGGADTILGGGGIDSVVGGRGADVIQGGAGSDKLVGSSGDDTIHGGLGGDAINGSTGIDACFQDQGTGDPVNCETTGPVDPVDPVDPVITADLAVDVSAPRRSASGDITFKIKVTNNGPDPAPVRLTLAQTSRRAQCDDPMWDDGTIEASLAPSRSWSDTVTAHCDKTGRGARVRVNATVKTTAVDLVVDNNSDSASTRLTS